MEAIIILAYLVSLSLAIITLGAALRWPLIRGKHLLCLVLVLDLAGRAMPVLISVPLLMTPAPVGLQTIGWLGFLSQTASSALLLVFVLIMGGELRGRLAQEREYGG